MAEARGLPEPLGALPWCRIAPGEQLALRPQAVHEQLATAVGLLPIYNFKVLKQDGREVPEAFEALEAWLLDCIRPI